MISKSHSEINWPLVGASFEGLSVVIEGYQRPTMKLLDDMKTLLKDSETVALIVKFSKRLYKYDRLKISIYQKFTHLGGFQLLAKIQQTKMLVTCQRFGDWFLFGLVWPYSSIQKNILKVGSKSLLLTCSSNKFWARDHP